MRLSLVRKISLGFGLLLIVLAVLSLVAVTTGRALVRNVAAVHQKHEVLSLLAEISVFARDLQSGYRGFVITGQEEFLEHYFPADTSILTRIEKLREHAKGDPRQLGRVDALAAQIKDLSRHGHELIEIRALMGREQALKSIEGGRGKQIMEAVRDLTGQIAETEKGYLARSRAESQSVLSGTVTTALLGGIVGVLAVGAAIIVLRADIREREKLEQALVMEGDREQRRVGQDLHDGLCQQLAGIGYLAKALQSDLGRVSADHARAAARITELIGAAVAQARNVSYGLHPVELVEDGLMSALRQLAATTQTTFGIPCQFECPSQVLVSDNEVAIHLYRIAREAVHNAGRHAKPKQIIVRLVARQDVVSLEIRDDGVGMPRDVVKGIGMQTMRFRADGLGGELVINSTPAAGTSVVCTFPARVAKVEPWQEEVSESDAGFLVS